MTDTFDQHWQRLGLESLRATLKSERDLRQTRVRDWDARTVRSERPAAPVAERTDLPRVSLSSPGSSSPDASRDLAVIGLLGEGGMGQVLLARQAALGRDVAIKVPRPDASPCAVQALVQEARTTGALEHPGVIPVYALASDLSGRPALVMKRVEGVPWSSLLSGAVPAWAKRGERDAGRLETHVDILVQVCNAVAFAHRRGVLHRDLKPENVLVGEFGEVYVADWGVAAAKLAPGEAAPEPALVGTPCYFAPEMVTGDDARMDERTDVFLLGATLYEVLAGRPPWDSRDLFEVCAAAWECLPPPVPEGTPQELLAICRKAMAALPKARYPQVVDLRDALAGFLRHRGSAKLAEASGERLAAARAALAAQGAGQGGALYSMLSECRFGFTEALREWPENEAARRGLRECLEVAARHEVQRGNAAAARALVRELGQAPEDLEAAVRALEDSDSRRHASAERLRSLSVELDPRVSMRQRKLFFGALAVAVGALVTVRNTVPAVREGIAAHGAAFMLGIMLAIALVYALGLWLGRRSLLATRVNRRIAAVLGAAIFGSVLNRALAIVTGSPAPTTLVGDLCLMCAVSFLGGFVLHWGFWAGAAILGAGAVGGALLPDLVSPIFGVTGIAAMGVIAWSWRTWKGELSDDREK